jgi:hypothetical protein
LAYQPRASNTFPLGINQSPATSQQYFSLRTNQHQPPATEIEEQTSQLKKNHGIMFAWLISHEPAVLFSQNKPATSNKPTILFSQNKPTPVIIHQPNEPAASS